MSYTLITGGLGYIGTHICVELEKITDKIIIIDNFCNSSRNIEINLKKLVSTITVLQCDLLNINILRGIFATYNITSVIHLASLKSINESIKHPIMYYDNNITGTLNLLKVMKDHNCFNLVFSSSASVYGNQINQPISESTYNLSLLNNPYANSKLFIETILTDISKDTNWNIIILRYFNPVGCHPSGLIGELPKNKPSNLFPSIIDVYKGNVDCLNIYGTDYNTKDGSCIRDFIHVVDLARAHICVLNYINLNKKINGIKIYNVGTGIGYSVFDIINCFNKHIKNKIKIKYCKRRSGDIPICYADNKLILQDLDWKPFYNLDNMVTDSLKWANNINSVRGINNSLYY